MNAYLKAIDEILFDFGFESKDYGDTIRYKLDDEAHFKDAYSCRVIINVDKGSQEAEVFCLLLEDHYVIGKIFGTTKGIQRPFHDALKESADYFNERGVKAESDEFINHRMHFILDSLRDLLLKKTNVF